MALLAAGAGQLGTADYRHLLDAVAAPPRAEQAIETSAALMRGGIANYMSTYWPVGDDAAETFSETFYKAALGGSTIGSALLAGRKAVLDRRDRDWADYILYGNFDFVLKQPASRA